MTTYYKCLAFGNTSPFGKDVTWSLPTQNPDGTWKPGEWMPDVEGELVLCANGYHYCELKDFLPWANDFAYTAEPGGKVLTGDDKAASQRIRLLTPTGWNSRTARLFAADCAERVLPIFEKAYPDDKRPRAAIEVAQRFAEGVATQKELTAAGNAAWAAAWDAAWDAAGAAAGAAARDAARAAARDAARDAAWAAARAAAWTAEAEWQMERLAYYLALPPEQGG